MTQPEHRSRRRLLNVSSLLGMAAAFSLKDDRREICRFQIQNRKENHYVPNKWCTTREQTGS